MQSSVYGASMADAKYRRCSTEESAVKFPYRGLFACSPEEFAGSSDIKKSRLTEADADGTTSMIGNGRVSLSCGVIDKNKGASQVLTLNCYRGNPSNTLGIIGTRIGFNTYLRYKPSKLANIPPGPLHNITMEKHVLKKTEVVAENLVSGDDEIVLSDMPKSFRIRDVLFGRGHYTFLPRRFCIEFARFWRFKTQSSITRTVPISRVVDGKFAFEISFFESKGWSFGQETAADGRFLLILWIDPVPGSTTCRFHLDAKHVSIESAGACFASAERPSGFKSRCELVFGDAIVCITSHRRLSGSSATICPRLTISPRQLTRNEVNARSQRRNFTEKKLVFFNYFAWTVPSLFMGSCALSMAPKVVTWSDSINRIFEVVALLILLITILVRYSEIIRED